MVGHPVYGSIDVIAAVPCNCDTKIDIIQNGSCKILFQVYTNLIGFITGWSIMGNKGPFGLALLYPFCPVTCLKCK
jgi:hypothetical protein